MGGPGGGTEGQQRIVLVEDVVQKENALHKYRQRNLRKVDQSVLELPLTLAGFSADAPHGIRGQPLLHSGADQDSDPGLRLDKPAAEQKLIRDPVTGASAGCIQIAGVEIAQSGVNVLRRQSVDADRADPPEIVQHNIQIQHRFFSVSKEITT